MCTPSRRGGHRLGVLRPGVVAHRCRVQALYLPALAYVGAAPMLEDGYAVLDLTLVEHCPKSKAPVMRLQQRIVLDREQPRRLVRMQVQVQLM